MDAQDHKHKSGLTEIQSECSVVPPSDAVLTTALAEILDELLEKKIVEEMRKQGDCPSTGLK